MNKKNPIFTGINFNVVFSHGNKVCLDHAEAWPHFMLRPTLWRAMLIVLLLHRWLRQKPNDMKMTRYLTTKPPLWINPYIILHYLISLHKHFLGTKQRAFQTFFLVVLGLEPRASGMLGKHFPIESDSWPLNGLKDECVYSSGVALQPMRIAIDNQYAPSFVFWGLFYLLTWKHFMWEITNVQKLQMKRYVIEDVHYED